jgi:hypothetical protein
MEVHGKSFFGTTNWEQLSVCAVLSVCALGHLAHPYFGKCKYYGMV